MTDFFATPDETQAWIVAEVARSQLVRYDEVLPGGGRRSFLWPRDAPPLPPPARGVLVWFPEMHGSTLTMGGTSWKASAFYEPTASTGRRLSQRLTRSLRKLATVPLYGVSYDGASRSSRPEAWASPLALSTESVLRQFPDGAVTFEP